MPTFFLLINTIHGVCMSIITWKQGASWTKVSNGIRNANKSLTRCRTISLCSRAVSSTSPPSLLSSSSSSSTSLSRSEFSTTLSAKASRTLSNVGSRWSCKFCVFWPLRPLLLGVGCGVDVEERASQPFSYFFNNSVKRRKKGDYAFGNTDLNSSVNYSEFSRDYFETSLQYYFKFCRVTTRKRNKSFTNNTRSTFKVKYLHTRAVLPTSLIWLIFDFEDNCK